MEMLLLRLPLIYLPSLTEKNLTIKEALDGNRRTNGLQRVDCEEFLDNSSIYGSWSNRLRWRQRRTRFAGRWRLTAATLPPPLMTSSLRQGSSSLFFTPLGRLRLNQWLGSTFDCCYKTGTGRLIAWWQVDGHTPTSALSMTKCWR